MSRLTFMSDGYYAVNSDNCFDDQDENYCGPAIDKLAEYENREETAHWEWYEHAYDWNLGGFVCSNCRAKNDNLPGMRDWGVKDPYLYVGSKFCPECGRKMVKEKVK